MSSHVIRIGQFSESPVLAVARALDLNTRFGIEWETQRVQSSPGQFESLRSNEIDIAITSPDNVLLYATTANNPNDRDNGNRMAWTTTSNNHDHKREPTRQQPPVQKIVALTNHCNKNGRPSDITLKATPQKGIAAQSTAL
jgi:hypothetical protein